MSFLNRAEYVYWRKGSLSLLSNMSSKRLFFQELTEFSQRTNVPDGPASNRDGFHLRDTCVSSPQLKMTICNKRDYLHHKKPKLQEQLLSKNNTILTRKERARCCSF
jgi:hypothetical protein